MSFSNNEDPSSRRANDEADPLFSISEGAAVGSEVDSKSNIQAHSPVQEISIPQADQATHAKHGKASSPVTKRKRRPSFGGAILAAGPTSDSVPRNTSLRSTQPNPLHSGIDSSEVDALGMLHNDVSTTNLPSSDAASAFIDHTAFDRPQRKSFQGKLPFAESNKHRRQSSLSSTSSGRKNRYIPQGDQTSSAAGPILPSPSQVTRPSFAEQWIARHEERTSPFTSKAAGDTVSGDGDRPNYGSTSTHDRSGRKNSGDKRHQSMSARYIPPGDDPFADQFNDAMMAADRRASTSSESDFEFSGSNPSSRRSSDSASLDDVCFPLADLNEEGLGRMWPDLQVLEEFVREEKADYEEMFNQNAAAFQKAQQDSKGLETRQSSFSGTSNQAVNFQHPLITSIDVNAPISKIRINETEPINGRLRPQRVVPWDPRSRQQTAPLLVSSANNVPTLPSNTNVDNSRALLEQFRFTYFREDLDATIHSPTISGLLHDDQTFADLFLPSHYGSLSQTASVQLDTGAGKSNNNSAPVSRTPTMTKTPTPSIRGLQQDSGTTSAPPFWLDVLNPTEEEMKVLSKAFGIHPLTTEDIFLGETREKVELFRDYYLVCFRSFDIVHERYKQKKAWEKAKEQDDEEGDSHPVHETGITAFVKSFFKKRRYTGSSRAAVSSISGNSDSSSLKARSRSQMLRENKQKGGYRHKPREGELAPLNMYIIVFRDGVLTFHFAPTPHPVNVRRRARLLRDYLTVSSDWIGYALIDDITDAFAPMIESIEDEVNSIEDAILKMNSYDSDDESDSSDGSSDDDDSDDEDQPFWKRPAPVKSTKSYNLGDNKSSYSKKSKKTTRTSSSSSSSSSASSKEATRVAGWKKKGDMLRRIGECRKRVMSILRLLGSKADVIKGFAKRCNEQWEVAPRSEIGMYLGDIQDHIVTMVQSLNHYEKLLARSHSNYLAQINIDMTRVNNDMNDVLGKITILGTVVLPMNIITGLWGMNVIVPGQDVDSLTWFFGIFFGMCLLAFICYAYASRAAGFST